MFCLHLIIQRLNSYIYSILFYVVRVFWSSQYMCFIFLKQICFKDKLMERLNITWFCQSVLVILICLYRDSYADVVCLNNTLTPISIKRYRPCEIYSAPYLRKCLISHCRVDGLSNITNIIFDGLSTYYNWVLLMYRVHWGRLPNIYGINV